MISPRTLLTLGSALLLGACSHVEPDGVVDDVLAGGFSGPVAKPPANVNQVPPPPPPGGPVRWKMRF
jgi:hypothetical protein